MERKVSVMVRVRENTGRECDSERREQHREGAW